MNKDQINYLLKDIKTDKERVKKSIYAILLIYNLKLDKIIVYRKKLNPSEIFITAIEECNLESAKKIMKKKYQNILPAPITVIEYGKKYYLFMGSNRSIIFILKGEIPDCVIVKIPDITKTSIFVSEAKVTLQEILEKQKKPTSN